MTNVDNEHPFLLPGAVDTNKFIVPDGNTLLHLYAKNKTAIMPTYKAKKAAKDFDVYLASEIPMRLHYSKK